MLFACLILLFNLFISLLLAFYPIAVWVRAKLFPKPILKDHAFSQAVSIIIACSNEEMFIRQKINSFLHPDEWIEGSEIIVVCNNSTDSTEKILAEFSSHPSITVIIEKGQSSKIRSINRAVKIARHQILVFSDCRQIMKKGSVKELVANFNDLEVGTVNSTLIDNKNGKGYSMRSILNFISHCESRSGSSLNVFGALYAQRKEVFKDFPEDMLFDDLFVVVSTLIQKKRLICEKNAVIYDLPFKNYYGSNRIQRLARGLLIFLFKHHDLIRQLNFETRLRFITFKYLKLILPFSLLIMAVDSIYLLSKMDMQMNLAVLILVFGFFIFKPCRSLLIQILRINYNFMIATIQFLFFNNRKNKWDKLKVTKNVG